MSPSKAIQPFVLAMGYRDDGWVSSILHVEQLHAAFVALATSTGSALRPQLYAPTLGHSPGLIERRWRYGQDLPAARLLHLIDPAYGDSLLVARGKAKAVVATVTDVAFWLRRTIFNTMIRRRIVQGLRIADCRIAISKQTAQEMEQHLGLRADRVIYLGVEPDIFFHAAQGRQANILLHVGSTIERKGIDRILRFLAILPSQVRLLQLGGTFTVEQRRLIASLNIAARIEQHPHASLVQLVAAYHLCGALIFPSRYEGYGVPCVEARLCGAPVLTTSVVPALEVLAGDPGCKALAFELFDGEAEHRYSAPELKRRREDMALEACKDLGRSLAVKNREWFGWSRVAAEMAATYHAIGAPSPISSEDLWRQKSS